MVIIVNCAVIILEIIGLWISVSDRKREIFVYYTQLSNIITLIASVVLVSTGSNEVSVTLRYLSSCMLTMTFLITLFVLVPMGAGFKRMMLSGNGLYHHTLCPVLSVASYIMLEEHSHLWMLPVILTFVYGVVMLVLNAKDKYDGPYPFFRVREQSPTATVLWVVVLLLAIAGIAAGVQFVAA